MSSAEVLEDEVISIWNGDRWVFRWEPGWHVITVTHHDEESGSVVWVSSLSADDRLNDGTYIPPGDSVVFGRKIDAWEEWHTEFGNSCGMSPGLVTCRVALGSTQYFPDGNEHVCVVEESG